MMIGTGDSHSKEGPGEHRGRAGVVKEAPHLSKDLQEVKDRSPERSSNLQFITQRL